MALDVGHVSLLLLLDMTAASFDTVDHDILIARLDKTFPVRQTPLQWFRTNLSGRSHQYYLHPHAMLNISFNQEVHRALYWDQFSSPSMFQTLRVSLPPMVPPGTSMQMTPNGHCCPEDVPGLVCRMSTCFKEIVSWTSSNHLHPDKTEAIWFGSPAECNRIGSLTLQFTGVIINLSHAVRSLGRSGYIPDDIITLVGQLPESHHPPSNHEHSGEAHLW